ncbi:Fur family transcriptional regulator [Methyloversatilis sp.]|uniref:Fur family transcriptional regulator n=1 Tax=Methyloversatilis sp. TaxID=2569862 RepID=UPI0035B322A7
MERNTRQRAAILGAIQRAGRPLSPAELHTLARDEAPALGLATVYRNIKMLLLDGCIREVDLPGEAPRYEEAHLGHHHHFKCRVCDCVFDIADCKTDWHAFAPPGFVVDAHEITLFGTCPKCSGQAPLSSPPHSADGHSHG